MHLGTSKNFWKKEWILLEHNKRQRKYSKRDAGRWSFVGFLGSLVSESKDTSFIPTFQECSYLLLSWKIEMVSPDRAKVWLLCLKISYKRFGLCKVSFLQLCNKPIVGTATTWVSSAPHPRVWGVKGNWCKHKAHTVHCAFLLSL